MRRTVSKKNAVILACIAVMWAAHAVAGAVKQIDIPAGELSVALAALAKQSGVELMYSTEQIRGLKTQGISGEYTAEMAAAKLLEGTRLQLKVHESGGLLISSAVATSVQTSQNPQASALQVARAEIESSGGMQEVAGASETDVTSGGEAPAGQGRDAVSKGIPEILVKGTRTGNADIRRTENDVQPYVIFEADDIQRSMAGNLEEFLMTRLPMNAASGNNAQTAGNIAGNQSSIDLRGLGANQTLILVNGRRMPGVFTGSDFNQPDINGIPLSSVQRIEVLPSTAGGIYGGGATGGVINIVLKRDYSGIEVSARYENTVDMRVAKRRVEATAGFSLEQGKTQVMISAGRSAAGVLTVSERDFLDRGRALLMDNYADAFYGSTTPPLGSTANIRSTDGTDLVLAANGVDLGSPITSVPLGYAGVSYDDGMAFAANAGQYNLQPPGGPQGTQRSLVSSPEVSSAALNLHRSFSDRVEAFVDISLYQNTSHADNGGFPTRSVTLQPQAPNNPFEQAIRVQFPASDFNYGARFESRSQTTAAAGGLIVRLPRSWTAQAEYVRSRSRNSFFGNESVITNDGRAALADGRLDILRDINTYPLDYSPYLYTPSPNVIVDGYETTLAVATLRLAGPVAALPAGGLMLSALIERREQDAEGTIYKAHFSPDTPTYIYYPPRGQATDSMYIEATAPLVSSVNARRLVRALELQVSYRYDETATSALANLQQTAIGVPSADGPFPDVPHVINRVHADQYTFGVRYAPAESLALRVSYGAGVLPPSVLQAAPLTFNNFTVFANDPKRGGMNVGSVAELSLYGSPDLLPEQSRSLSVGVILTPQVLQGLRLSLDYTRIAKSDEITNIGNQAILDLEDSLPGRIRRADLTDDDRAMNFTGGAIEYFDASDINVARSRLEAFDIQADYRWSTDTGEFRAHALGSYTTHLKRQVLEGSPLSDAVGYRGGPLRLRGNCGLSWTRNEWTAGWNMQYYDSHRIYTATSSDFFINNVVRDQGTAWIPSQTYHDMFLKYRVGGQSSLLRGLLSDSEWMLGVSNVLDTSPPILATSSVNGGGYSAYGDPRLRRFSISFSKRFGM